MWYNVQLIPADHTGLRGPSFVGEKTTMSCEDRAFLTRMYACAVYDGYAHDDAKKIAGAIGEILQGEYSGVVAGQYDGKCYRACKCNL